MKTQIMITAAALAAATGLHAQLERAPILSFQTFSANGGEMKTIFDGDQISARPVTGRPFSGTEERHTLQVLADGTRIEKTETDRLYRDTLGRTRTERPDGTVLISDPVEGTLAEFASGAKKVMTRAVRRNTFNYTAIGHEEAQSAKIQAGGVQRQSAIDAFKKMVAGENSQQSNEEKLGLESVNGVTAQHTRSTITIEAGQIGNDRPIQIVSERWYSDDLQMLVKSSNSDPRFGDSTYQLTGISQAVPAASLFQIPSDYTQEHK